VSLLLAAVAAVSVCWVWGATESLEAVAEVAALAVELLVTWMQLGLVLVEHTAAVPVAGL
jgi:hypothetical protein